MPYRRLPNTDTARIAALEKAVAMELTQTPDRQPASFKVLNDARTILSHYKAAVHQFRYNYDQLAKSNKQLHPLVKTARMYISHFIQVLNMTIIRNEIKAEYKELYNLPIDDYSTPDLSTEQAIKQWGKNIIDGENKRMAYHRGTPIYNPTIGKVKVHYDLFIEAQYTRERHRAQMLRSQEQLLKLRQDVDNIILDIWNQVEKYYSSLPADIRLNKCREYGIIYYLRKNEKQKLW